MEAILACLCLAFILWGDPGVIRRTPENCLPLPSEVKELLEAKLARGDGRDLANDLRVGGYAVTE